MAGSQEEFGARLVRPKDAAISCSHLWANSLIVAGLACFVVGAIVFSEWRGIGSFWVGVVGFATGVSGTYVTQSQASGGAATGFYIFLSLITLVAALVSIALGDGTVYLAVRETGGNCFDGDDCPADFCASTSCVCWEPDGTESCSDIGSARYCLRYGGDSCGDIGDSEGLLMGSSIVLLMIAVFSFGSLLVSISTCWYCKRTIIADSIIDEDTHKKVSSAATMPINVDTRQPVEDDEHTRRTSGIALTRPFPRVVKASHALGWILIAVGLAEVVVGSLVFKDWQVAGGFWVGIMAWAAGVAGTCVQINENSGGFPTGLFCFQSFICLVAAALSLILVDGLVYNKVQSTEGNCSDVSSCLESICGGYECVCWEPDGSTECSEGTSTRTCLQYKGGDCNDIEDYETLLGVSSLLHIVIIGLVTVALCVASAVCWCCNYTVLMRKEKDGVVREHRL
eukprot:g8164.t1